MTYILAVAGRAGVGKSTIAKTIASYNKGVILSTDSLRSYEENMDLPKDAYSNITGVKYIRERTYKVLFNMAEDLIFKGENVVADGTFEMQAWRDELRNISLRTNIHCYIIEVICSDKGILKSRLKKRRGEKNESASWEVNLGQSSYFEPIGENEKIATIDTALKQDLNNTIEDIISRIIMPNENRPYR
ncbi:MAG: AAA family ATPase [Actinomycetia bacterium]|nr:AAA family ATPase [Actinomycetes bacterium]